MKENDKKPLVALIFGGRGYEHGVSVKSAEYILSVTDRSKMDILPIYISRTGEWLCSDMRGDASLSDTAVFSKEVSLCRKDGRGGILSDDGFIPIDCAIPVLHGDFGEDGIVQGALENAKIRYVGCDTVCGAVCSDKAFTKAVAHRLGIPVARYVSSYCGEDCLSLVTRAERELDFPIFVKPSRLGSSVGASVAASHVELIRSAELALSLSPHVITEEKIDIDCELECAYFGAMDFEIFTDVGKISCRYGFYDFGSKYEVNSRAHVTASAYVPKSVSDRIKKYSSALKNALKIRHLSRFDFFLTAGGEIIFNEINTFPGFTASSLYPALLERSGISPSEAVSLFVADALRGGT